MPCRRHRVLRAELTPAKKKKKTEQKNQDGEALEVQVPSVGVKPNRKQGKRDTRLKEILPKLRHVRYYIITLTKLHPRPRVSTSSVELKD